MRDLAIAYGNNRQAKTWVNKTIKYICTMIRELFILLDLTIASDPVDHILL